MSKIKLMTDSASDIPEALEKELDIKILCFPLTVGDEGYHERIDFTNEEFYDVISNSPKLPSTSQITPIIFLEEFEEVYNNGYDSLIYVSINGKGSATYNNSAMAKETFYEKHPDAIGKFDIHLIDGKTYTIAYGYAVVEAAKKAQRQVPIDEILGFINDWIDSVVVYFAPLTLECAKKSGRISCATAFVGELVGLKPIIRIMDGEMDIIQKVRGEKAVIPALLKYAKDTMIPHTPYLSVYGKNKAISDDLIEQAQKELSYEEIDRFEVGAAIAINSGPYVVGIIVKGENRGGNK